jgi:hypothetical protein
MRLAKKLEFVAAFEYWIRTFVMVDEEGKPKVHGFSK